MPKPICVLEGKFSLIVPPGVALPETARELLVLAMKRGLERDISIGQVGEASFELRIDLDLSSYL